MATDIYMSPNYFPGLVEPPGIACPALAFCKGYPGIVSFSFGLRDGIEDMASQVAKVQCFPMHYGTSPGTPPRLTREVMYS